MNRRIFLMRHGSAENNAESDFKRTLSEKGIDEVMQAAKFLKDHRVDKILASYVKRTMQTAEILMQSMPPTELEMVTEFYEGKTEDIIHLLSNQSDLHKHILCVAHKPQLFDFLISLVEESDPKYDQMLKGIVPAQVVILDFPGLSDWQDLRKNRAKIHNIFAPTE